MIILYGTRTIFKRDGANGQRVCPNCGHTAPQTLCRQLNQGTLFFIPIASFEVQRGSMCESCGCIQPIDRAEYKQLRRDLREREKYQSR